VVALFADGGVTDAGSTPEEAANVKRIPDTIFFGNLENKTMR
jgi:hypothetical protein